jgi:rhodanese-related sulfurtransferase
MKFISTINVSCILLLASILINGSVAGAEEAIVKNIPGSIKVNAEELIALVEKNPALIIIDARIVSDRLNGYIEGSISLPDIDTNCETLARIIPDKKTPALFYCNGPKCGRSAKSVKIALDCGFTNVYWFYGGFEEWQNKKYPLVKD